jgi:hypothetical protein
MFSTPFWIASVRANDRRARIAGSRPELCEFGRVQFLGFYQRRPQMGRGLLLWLIGIPLPIILLIWLFGGLS